MWYTGRIIWCTYRGDVRPCVSTSADTKPPCLSQEGYGDANTQPYNYCITTYNYRITMYNYCITTYNYCITMYKKMSHQLKSSLM